MIRILVVDDAEVVRKAIVRVLSTHPECRVVSEASNAGAGIEEAKHHQPDVVLLDISMPEMNGLQAISLIRSAAPHTEILMVTQHDNRFFVREAFAAGARGFLNKGDLGTELADAVSSVFLKNRFLSSRVRTLEIDLSGTAPPVRL